MATTKSKTAAYISLALFSSLGFVTPSRFMRSLTAWAPALGVVADPTAMTRSRPSGHFFASKRNSHAVVGMIPSFHCLILINNSAGITIAKNFQTR